MKKGSLITITAILLLISAFTFVVPKQWAISAGYKIKFSGKFADGTFENLKGTILFDPMDLAKSSFEVTVDVRSIDTGKELKNKHAISDKWFDVEKFPFIHFISSEVVKTDSAYVVNGALNLHGVKKEISIPFTFTEENGKAFFRGNFKVNRGEFGIGKSAGKDSDYTSVEISVPVTGI